MGFFDNERFIAFLINFFLEFLGGDMLLAELVSEVSLDVGTISSWLDKKIGVFSFRDMRDRELRESVTVKKCYIYAQLKITKKTNQHLPYYRT